MPLAPAPSSIGVLEPGSPTKALDSTQVVTSAGTVEREGVFVGSPSNGAARAEVTEHGLAVDVQRTRMSKADFLRQIGVSRRREKLFGKKRGAF